MFKSLLALPMSASVTRSDPALIFKRFFFDWLVGA
jgi:hypothetical protein